MRPNMAGQTSTAIFSPIASMQRTYIPICLPLLQSSHQRQAMPRPSSRDARCPHCVMALLEASPLLCNDHVIRVVGSSDERCYGPALSIQEILLLTLPFLLSLPLIFNSPCCMWCCGLKRSAFHRVALVRDFILSDIPLYHIHVMRVMHCNNRGCCAQYCGM